ncbi:MAG: hypothetical protein JWM95_5083 [Gemmatimonadetes bacterium]|nr:hypothetical protein [Gemmatimonadota bacterium]
MPRTLGPAASLDNLKREAKRWHTALLARNADAARRIARVIPHVPAQPTLRDVQHALAREFGFVTWPDLKTALHAGVSAPPATLVDLLAAANEGNAARVAELLDATPELVNKRGLLPGHIGLRTALHFAMNGANADVVALLLDRGADPGIRDEGDNAVPLHFAAEKENLPIIALLVEHGSEVIGAGDDHELEIIGWATCFGSGRKDVVDYLLAHGARHNIFSAVAVGDVEAITANAHHRDRGMDRANNRRRPLHLAVVKKRAESLGTLLELGADREATDVAGLTPLDQAALSNETGMVETLLAAGASVRLPSAVALERYDDVERLLAEAPDALRPGAAWGALLIHAAECASRQMMELLLERGAFVNVGDVAETSTHGTSGYTPLHAAAFYGNVAAAELLLERGANVRARDSRYCGTPAGWADYRGNIPLRDVINTGTIDLFEVVNFGLLHRVADIVSATPNEINRRFREFTNGSTNDWIDPSFTPLMHAVKQGKADAVRVLLEHGADAALRDSSGRSALDIAAGNPHIARLLEHAVSRTPPHELPERPLSA